MQSSLESICDLLNFDNGDMLMMDAHDTINHADTPSHQILDVGDVLDESVEAVVKKLVPVFANPTDDAKVRLTKHK